MPLWNHQREAIDFIRKNTIQGGERSLICMPPGAGKSEIAVSSLLEWLRISSLHRAIVCVPGNRLLAQFYARLVQLTSERIDFEQGRRRSNHHSRLILASQHSLVDRLHRHDESSLVVIDEAHHSSYDAPLFSQVADRFKRVIGLTATPWTNGLVKLFPRSNFYGLTQAIKDRVVCPVQIIREDSLYVRAHCPTPVFVSNNETARRLCAAIPNSDWIGHSRSEAANFTALNRWRSGFVNPLFVNRMLLEGYDLPEIEAIWIDMDVSSLVLCAQVIGRALRYREGKVARIYVLSDRTEQTAHDSLRMLDTPPK